MALPFILIGAAALSFAGAGVGIVVAKHELNELNERRKQEFDEWHKLLTQLNHRPPKENESLAKASDSPKSPDLSRLSPPYDLSSSSSLEIQNENGDTIVYISEIADPKLSRWENVNSSEENPIFRLNPLLSAVPTAAISGNISTTQYMIVQLAGDLTPARDGVGWRAWTMNKAGGGIKEHAKLFSPEELHSIVGVGALWQIASLALAQKHLYDINKKLGIISHQIERISTFQKNDRTSKISGCKRYFEQVYEDIRHGIISNISQNLIELKCASLTDIEEHLYIDIKSKLREIEKEELGDDFDKLVSQLMEHFKELFSCVHARCIGYRLMMVVNEDPSFVSRRLDRIQVDLETIKNYIRRFLHCIMDALGSKISMSDDRKELAKTLEMLQELRSRDELGRSLDHVCEEAVMAKNFIDQRKMPQEVFVKVNGGRIEGFSVVEGTNVNTQSC